MQVKKFIVGLLVFFCVSFAMFAIGCNEITKPQSDGDNSSSSVEETQKIVLVDFEDEEIEFDVGTVYQVKNPDVHDQNGNKYNVTCIVKNHSGEVVPLIAGAFEVYNVKGYVIEYSVKLSDTDIRRKNVTVKVKDVTAPVIQFGDAEIGYIGEEFVLPSFTAIDDSENECTLEIKLYNKESGKEIVFNDNKFIPESTGVYLYKVKATDAVGNASEAEKEFTISSKLDHFVLGDFADINLFAQGINFSKFNTTEGWVESFEGANGVGWATGGTMEYKNFALRFGTNKATMEEYDKEGWDYFAIRMYIDKPGTYQVLSWNIRYLNDRLLSTQTNPVPGKKWVTVYMARDVIDNPQIKTYWQNADMTGGADYTGIKAFNYSPLRKEGMKIFWISGALDSDTKVYVDEMRLVKGCNLSLEVQNENALYEGEKVNVTIDSPDNIPYNVTVTGPENENIEFVENGFNPVNIGNYTITVTPSSGECFGVVRKVVTVKPLVSITCEDINNAKIGDNLIIPDAVVTNNKTGAVVEGATVKINVYLNDQEITLNNGGFVIEESGLYTVKYTYNNIEIVKTFNVFADYYYTSFENIDEFTSSKNVAKSEEQKVSYNSSAKFDLSKGEGQYVFTTPVSQKIISIGMYIYSEKAGKATFLYSTGAYSYGGGTSAQKKAQASTNEVVLEIKAGWNLYEIDVKSTRDILIGKLLSIGLKSETLKVLYMDNLTFYSSDLTFENDVDQGTTWAGKVYGERSNDYAHSGEYSAKLALKRGIGGCFYHFANPIKVTGKKISGWVYNTGAQDFGGNVSAGYEDRYNQACDQYIVFKSRIWTYFEININNLAMVQQNGIKQIMFWSNSASATTIYIDDITFVDANVTVDDGLIGTWEGKTYATPSEKNSLDGMKSAEVSIKKDKIVYYTFGANVQKTTLTKIGMWIYNPSKNPFSASFSVYTNKYTNDSGVEVAGGAKYNKAINGHIVPGWQYYEFEFDITQQEAISKGGIAYMGLWSGSGNATTIYVDNITYIV